MRILKPGYDVGIAGSNTPGKKQRLKPDLSGKEHYFTTTRGSQVPDAKKELTKAEQKKRRQEKRPFKYNPVESLEIEYDEYDGDSERGAQRVANRNAAAYGNFVSLLNYDQALENREKQFETDTAVTAIRQQTAEQQYIRNQQIRDLQIQAQLEAYELNQQQVKDQLAFNQDATEQALTNQQQLLDDRLRGIDFQTQGVQLDQAQRDLEFSSRVEGIRAEVTGAENQFGLNQRGAELQRDQQLQQSFDAINNERSNRDQQIQRSLDAIANEGARSAYSAQEVKIQELVETGAQAARGQKGNSARRAVQSIQALSGMNTARIADDLLRFKTQQEKQQGFARSDFARFESQQQTQQGFARSASTLAVDRAKEEQRAFKERASLERATIEIDYEVATNRMNLSLEELGESMISATNAFENEKVKIFQDKFQADAAAMASEMLKPRFADPALPPFVIPQPEFNLPPLPIEVPKGQLPPPAPSGPSGLSKALMIGGAVLGAVATGGGSIGLLGAAPALSGYGLSAFGAGVAGAGRSGFFD